MRKGRGKNSFSFTLRKLVPSNDSNRKEEEAETDSWGAGRLWSKDSQTESRVPVKYRSGQVLEDMDYRD